MSLTCPIAFFVFKVNVLQETASLKFCIGLHSLFFFSLVSFLICCNILHITVLRPPGYPCKWRRCWICIVLKWCFKCSCVQIISRPLFSITRNVCVFLWQEVPIFIPTKSNRQCCCFVRIWYIIYNICINSMFKFRIAISWQWLLSVCLALMTKRTNVFYEGESNENLKICNKKSKIGAIIL